MTYRVKPVEGCGCGRHGVASWLGEKVSGCGLVTGSPIWNFRWNVGIFIKRGLINLLSAASVTPTIYILRYGMFIWNLICETKKCVILPKQRFTNRGTSIPDLLVLCILISTPGAGSGREEAQGLHHFQSSSMCRWGLRDSLHNWIPDNFLPTVYNRETMWRGLTCRVALERLEDANAHLRAKQKAMKDTMTAGLL